MAKSLKQSCIFVKGAKNAALYDLIGNKVYALNKTGKSFIEDFVSNSDKLSQEGLEFIKKLENLNLIDDSKPLILNESEPIPSSSCQLRYAWLELTQQCNLRCIHCY